VSRTAPDPESYYFDLRHKATAGGPEPSDGAAVIAGLTADRDTANPVDILQFGLGALQLRDRRWLACVAATADWVEREQDDDGLLAYRFAMPHTFPLDPPWYSSMAQGQAGSFLVRAAVALEREPLFARAERAVAPLVDAGSPLVLETPEGLILEEYPTSPPSFVLNGWITSLFGLRDVALAPVKPEVAAAAGQAFEAGVATVAARLGLYRVALGWTRYDLYPHPLVNVASPAYHRVHIGHIRTLQELAPRPEFAAALREWERAATSPGARALALTRKIAFRLVRPRSRRVRPRSV
jgi:heparosan-N-sulfate-glucuronate 5-epimerase